MYAVDDLSDAIDATRSLLTPIDIWLWIKLSLVVLLVVGVGGGGPTLPSGDVGAFAEGPEGEFETDEAIGELPDDIVLFVAVIVAIVVAVWLVFAFISAVMEFVFIESLRSRAVHVRRYTGQNVGRGTRLFLFRAIAGLLLAAITFGPIVFVWLAEGTFDAVAGVALVAVAVGFLAYIPYAIVMRFTSEFVAPIMLLEGRGVLSGWRRFLGTLSGNWGEYIVYLLLAWIIMAVVQFGISFVFAIAALLVAIPFVLLIVLALLVPDVGVFLAIPIGILLTLVLILLYALIWMPVRSYFQYYALLLLGDTTPDLDLIPDLRAEIRADGGRPPEREDDGQDHPDGNWGSDDGSRSWGDDRRDDTDDGTARDADDSDPWDDGRDDSGGWDTEDKSDSDQDEYDPWGDNNTDRDDGDDKDDANRGW